MQKLYQLLAGSSAIILLFLPALSRAVPYGTGGYGNCVYGQNKTGDISLDCKVNIIDFSILTTRWDSADAAADLNKNGKVDVYDLTIMINNWEG